MKMVWLPICRLCQLTVVVWQYRWSLGHRRVLKGHILLPLIGQTRRTLAVSCNGNSLNASWQREQQTWGGSMFDIRKGP